MRTTTPEQDRVIRAVEFGQQISDSCTDIVLREFETCGTLPEYGTLTANYTRALNLIETSRRNLSTRSLLSLLVSGLPPHMLPVEISRYCDGSVPRIEALRDDVTNMSDELAQVLRKPEYGYSGLNEPDTCHSLSLALQMVGMHIYAPPDQSVINHSGVIMMGLVHDLDEVVAGDIPTLSVSEQDLADKKSRVAEDLAELCSRYPQTAEVHYLIRKYHMQATIDARTVKVIDKALPSQMHGLNAGIVLKRDYGFAKPEDYTNSISATNRILARGYTDLPFYISVVNEARARAIVCAFDGMLLSDARDIVYKQAVHDGLHIPTSWSVTGSVTLDS